VNYNAQLAKLNVTMAQTEAVVGVLGTFPKKPTPQVRLSVLSEVVNGKKVGGEVIFFESDDPDRQRSMWTFFETGLFRAWIATDRRTLDHLWQTSSAPFDSFTMCLTGPDVMEYGKEVWAEIEFSYEVQRGKYMLDELPSS
jgi:hypothetical protein